MNMRSLLRGATALLATSGAVVGAVASEPASSRSGTEQRASPIEMTVMTSDGAKLRVKRYPGDGSPVLLIHGLAANRRCFDLEPVSGSGFEYRSLADELQARGHDVWLVNLRGVGIGDERSALPDGATTWTLDEHIILDVPAVVKAMRATTKRRPFILGHSMGGLVTAVYLQGARWREADDPGSGVVLDATLAAKRSAATRGAVLVAPALRMKWSPGRRPWWFALPAQLEKLLEGSLLPDRVPLRKWTLSTRLALEAADDDGAPGASGGDEGGGDVEIPGGGEGDPDDDALSEWGKRLLHQLLDGAFGPAANRPAVIMKRVYKGVIDDCSKPVLRQFLDGIRHGTVRSGRIEGREPIDYTRGYARLEVPILVVLGVKDRLVDHLVVQELFELDAMPEGATPPPERRFEVLETYGHVDLLLGGNATRDVYPTIVEFLARWSH